MATYTERTPTLCTCPTTEVTINGVTYPVPPRPQSSEPCPTHGEIDA